MHSNCDYDYVAIYDGPDVNSNLIGRYCGTTIPTELIRTTSNTMTVNFVTDSSVQLDGFTGAYETTYGNKT